MLMVYLFVNSLFVLKYGIRQDIISEYILLVFYLSFVLGGLFFLEKKKIFINNLTQFRKSFLFIAILVFLVFVAVNLIVDGQTLNTDRWSALEVSIRSVLNFEYPYDKLDHLGGRSSNLPGLIYIGLPFYLLGDVGLLQPFVFLLRDCLFLVLKLNPSSQADYLYNHLILLPRVLLQVLLLQVL